MAQLDLTPPLGDEAAVAALEILSLHQLAAAADAVRARHHGNEVRYRNAEGAEGAGDAGEPGVAAFTWSTDDAAETRLAALRHALARPGITAIRLEREDGGVSGSGIDDLTTVAWARLVVPGEIHLIAPWAGFGGKLGQVALEFGVDDLGTVSTGAEEGLRRWVTEAGRTPVRHDA